LHNFDNIVVDTENHGYRIGDQNLISATTLVSRIKPDFDKDGVSKRVAERDGITQEEVLRQWDKKGEFGRDRGTRLHCYIEDLMVEKIDPITRAVNDRIPAMDAFDKVWEKMSSKLKAKLKYQECVVGDSQYCVAGRVDAIFDLDIKGKESSHIFDWKTGKFRVDNQYEKLLPPFDDVDSCELNAYSIQLSLYRLIIEKNTDMKLSDSYLVHLRDDGEYMMHRAKDFRSRLHEWLSGGLPQDFVGDAVADKKSSDIVKILSGFDHKLLRKISYKNRQALSAACRKLNKALQIIDMGSNDDL
jgi:hypothetical protein